MTQQAATTPPPATVTAIEPRRAGFEPENWREAAALSERLARATIIPVDLRNKPDDVLVIITTGRDLGLTAAQSLNGIYVVKGKPALATDTMAALILQSPVCEQFYPEKLDASGCTYVAKRKGQPAQRFSFSIEQARNAGLLGNDTWKKYPDQMCANRAGAIAAKKVFPDVIKGIAAREELEDDAFARATQVEPTSVPPPPVPPPAPPASGKGKKTTPAPASKPEPEDAEIVPEPSAHEPPPDDVLPPGFESVPPIEETAAPAPGSFAEQVAIPVEDRVKGYLDLINAADSVEVLQEIAKKLNDEEPKGGEVRTAVGARWNSKKAELGRGRVR